MSKKVSKFNTPRARRARRRKNPAAIVSSPASNPPLFRDLAEFVGPGFAGYAGTRLLSRVAYVQLSKRWPKAGRHLAVGSSVASFLIAWFLLHRVRRLEKYHTPAAVGSAIAALQTIIQTYLPKFGWMVSDYQPLVPAQIAPAPAPEIDDTDDLDDAVEDISSMGTLGTLAGSTIGRAPASAFTKAAKPPAAAPPIDDSDDLDLGDDDDYAFN